MARKKEHEIIIKTIGGKFKKTTVTIDGQPINAKAIVLQGDCFNDLDIGITLAVNKASEAQAIMTEAQADEIQENAQNTTQAIGFIQPDNDECFDDDDDDSGYVDKIKEEKQNDKRTKG